MLILYLINLLAYFYIQILKLRYLSKFFKKEDRFFNPFNIVFISQLPIDVLRVVVGPIFILENGVSNKYYNVAIFCSTLSFFVDYLLLKSTFFVSKKYTFVTTSFDFSIKKNRIKISAVFFYVLFFTCLFLLASSSFGFINWLLNPREGYQFHRSGAGFLWVLAISFLSVSFVLSSLYAKSRIKLFLIFFIYAFSAYFLGSKGIVLDFFLYFLIILWLTKYKKLKYIYIIMLPLVFGIMLYNFFSSAGTTDFKEVFSYFDHYVNATMYYEAYYTNKIDLFYGKVYFSDFWNLVPRGVYPNKPYVFGITHVNEFFFPGAAEETNTPAFGGAVNYFADFGIAGVILFSFINPIKFISYFFLCQLLKNYTYESIVNNSYILLLFILFTAPYFLFYLIFPLNMALFFFISVIILLFNRITLFKKN